MTSHPGRLALLIFGVIALLVGALFTGQGLGFIPGSFMTGDRTWFYVGVVLVVAGIAVIAASLRRPGRDG